MGFRAAAIAVCLVLGLGSAQAREFVVSADQAGLIRLPGDAAGVIVGNPGIADATLYDSRTLFVTGKVFGRTNLIVLDDAGRVLYTSDLVVAQPDSNAVQIFRNSGRPETYVCAPTCQALPQIGDDQVWFNDMNIQRNAIRDGAGPASN
ncbi:MAG: pilus assembly protein [Oceanicaulis sp.]|jgi:Flp pilus assembly secretin CpaC|uniref:pilus assembly protein N-terminal domain-containing protein n=1 Tax=Oceanicaulis TaxID=153232 RepID=UPI0003B6A72C|nr:MULTISPECIES: pilus assembly protein N-terminal domain-containing protein [Oceanicaulis]MAP48082.1 pilus assembly protein [Oceanicaulis sp.]MBL4537619.1 pilus assembly protein N-terminal domain-containing protein [Oceanicaulis sp.]MBL4544483.1 pilus assembly protein N-terminal domain-containing protein [Oceanicaulis sp.]VXC98762.1 Pilus assembly protein [Oceanicaulis sp. 350]|tara:strand:+ start:1560 stop:2006 length:447 start_codon:yes stop_codon:yes gene_type:complete